MNENWRAGDKKDRYRNNSKCPFSRHFDTIGHLAQIQPCVFAKVQDAPGRLLQRKICCMRGTNYQLQCNASFICDARCTPVLGVAEHGEVDLLPGSESF